MTKAEAQKAFKARLIPWGMKLMNRAEAHGVDWERLPIEKLEAAVIFAEELATPDEYKNNPFTTNQGQYHG
jgi:hypothetical protein